MEKDLISVIVCTYNTSLYVSKCLDSLLNQTYQHLEVLVIEDGSSDDTLEILKEYEKKDSRIRLFVNDKNQGLAYSRNLGLQKAVGKYIGFIDSDDFVDSSYYMSLYQSIIENQSEVSVCDIKSYYESSGSFLITKGCMGDVSSKLSFLHTGLASSACNKLFCKNLFDTNPFAVGKVNEDVAVILPILVKAQKISYVSDVFYTYVQRDNSIQNSSFSDRKFDIFIGVESTLKKIAGCDNFEEIRQSLIFQQIILLFLYEFPKISNSRERRVYLKKFYQYANPYALLKNSFLPSFLEGLGTKTRMFYRLILILECHRMFFLTNFFCSFYRFLKQRFQTIDLPSFTLSDLERLAQEHVKLPLQTPTISVVIPNYNYERFLHQRIASILKQRVRISELIILDDCSSDSSREVIEACVQKLSSYFSIRAVYNSQNSGSPFSQWEKGFSLSSSDYVWICEADDYCHSNLLKELVKPIKRQNNIVISYCDTAMIDGNGSVLSLSVTPMIDIQHTGHWKRSYVINGVEEIKKYAYLNGTIANVSSALIKNGEYSSFFAKARRYKQAGDWLFYLQVMQKGNVAYSPKVYNYYRIHGNNVTSVTKKKAHLKEIKQVHDYIEKNFSLTKEQKREIKRRYKYLAEVWELDQE